MKKQKKFIGKKLMGWDGLTLEDPNKRKPFNTADQNVGNLMVDTPDLGLQQPQQAQPDLNHPQQPQHQQSGAGHTFTTPGTGDIIGGMIGFANALVGPHQSTNQFHKSQYGTYNTFSQGTGSQAIYEDGGGIHIKPENRGKFTAWKQRTGETTEEALHSDNPHVRQMANFARNASHWQHPDGGKMPAIQEGFFPQNDSQATINNNIATYQYQNAYKQADSTLNTPQAWQIPYTAQQYNQQGIQAPVSQAYNDAVVNRIYGPALKTLHKGKMPDGGKMAGGGEAPIATPVQRNISYEPIQRQDHTMMYAPVFNGNWSYNDVHSAMNNIPDKMNNSPVIRGDAWNALYDGVRPGTNSSQWKRITGNKLPMLNQSNGAIPRSGSWNNVNDRYEGPNGPLLSTQKVDASMVAKMPYGGTVHTNTRKVGGITVNEEIPDNLGYGQQDMAQLNPSNPFHTPSPNFIPQPVQNQPKNSVGYEALQRGGKNVYAPVFHGNWSGKAKQDFYSSSPNQLYGSEVLKGDAMSDITPSHQPAPTQLPTYSFGKRPEVVHPTYDMWGNDGQNYLPMYESGGAMKSVTKKKWGGKMKSKKC